MGKSYLTREKYKQLVAELDRMKRVDRREISLEIGVAREKGDLRENAEYDAAREKQAHIEKRIAELEEKLSQTVFIDDLHIDTSKVNIGAIVELEDMKSGEKIRYELVGPDESDYEKNKISVTSPVGGGLLGYAKGDIARIKVPAGFLEYKIVGISYEG